MDCTWTQTDSNPHPQYVRTLCKLLDQVPDGTQLENKKHYDNDSDNDSDGSIQTFLLAVYKVNIKL